MEKAKRLKPKVGAVYTNKGGGAYVCRSVWEGGTAESSWDARMVNVKSGWSFIAHGLVQYEDGTIEWDYSSGGSFEEVAKHG